MVTADAFVQQRLLPLADLDHQIATAHHRRATLPELAIIASNVDRLEALRSAEILAQTEVADLDGKARKLDAEIDQVRSRAKRDADRLAAGTGPAKDLANLQHEVESLARRQSVLEDQALELMELREEADAVLSSAQQALGAATSEVDGAVRRRDASFADIDAELARLHAERAEHTGGIPAALLAIYDRVRTDGRIAAARMEADRCGACKIEIDRVALDRIRSASADAVLRCEECGAILVRTA